jgi:cation transport regulator
VDNFLGSELAPWNSIGLFDVLGIERVGEKSDLMPYRTNRELPDSVKDNLPSHAQDIYREAFDSAWDEYQDPDKRRGSESREEVAHKVAWAAVKQKYEKVGNQWRSKS